MSYIKIIIVFFFLFLTSCSSNKEVSENLIENDDLEIEMIKTYKEALEALESGDAYFASKKFNEVEILFPQSDWAPKASLMSAYSYWSQQYYSNSIEELERFIKLYPNNSNLDYAYYLLAMCYYDSIVDEKKDLLHLIKSKKYFVLVIKKFPNTDYALDAKYKIGLIQDFMAAKELYIARHYIIGLENEAQKYAKTLGYNYETSEWYEESYRVFNKNYESIRKIKKKNKRKKLTEKVKSFF